MDISFWHDKRPAGVANSINTDNFPSILSLIDELLTKHSHRSAFTSIGHTLTFQQIDQYSRQFAAYIQHETPLEMGDHIAIQLPNTLQYVITVYGAIRAGLVIVNTNPLYTAREMRYQFQDSDVKAVVFLENFAHLIEEVIEDTKIEYTIVSQLGDLLPPIKRFVVNSTIKYVKRLIPEYKMQFSTTFREVLKKGSRLPYQKPESTGLDTPFILQYTGGTTGKPKGAILTQGNLIANMLQAKEVLSQVVLNPKKRLSHGEEIMIAPLPLYHIYAFTVHLLCMPYLGNQSILIANPRDTNTFIRLIKPWKFTGFIGLNTLFVNLMNHPNFKKCQFSQLKFTLSGGTSLQKSTNLSWKAITDCDISEAYGLTECAPAVCINPIGGLSQVGAVGLPVPSTALKVINKQGDEFPLEEIGELCVKGPQVMLGYWKNDTATQEVKDEQGWLKTGDLALIKKDGFVKIVDRIKDVILVSGFNVYPNEIEEVLSHLKKIMYCAAIGVPDKKTGEAIKLFVVKKDPKLTEEDIKEFCRLNLAAYKIPTQIEFRNSLPMSPIGKVLRKELRQI